MNNAFYMPILKSKHGEFLGLSKLRDPIKVRVVPLLEVTPLEWSAEGKKPKTLEVHLDLFCKRYLQNWNSDNCFIDTVLLNWNGTDNSHRIEYITDKLAQSQIFPCPVVHVDSPSSLIAAINSLASKYGITELGIRVTPNELTAPEFIDDIHSILQGINLTPQSCHLIFDLVASDFTEVDNLALGVEGIVATFPNLKDWKTFTITGSAFPSSKAIKEGVSEFPRNDLKFYKKLLTNLAETEFARLLNFGDYSIVNPAYFEFDPRFMKPSANIKYALNDKWIITKGKKLGAAQDYAQYKRLANDISSGDFYLGEEFSDGDLYIARCASGQVGTGQPRTWVWVGHNHHITKTVSDLFANPVGS